MESVDPDYTQIPSVFDDVLVEESSKSSNEDVLAGVLYEAGADENEIETHLPEILANYFTTTRSGRKTIPTAKARK